MGDGCLNNEHFEELGGILKGKLEEHFKNQELRQGTEFLSLSAKIKISSDVPYEHICITCPAPFTPAQWQCHLYSLSCIPCTTYLNPPD